jgi:hypothetical protein
MLKIRISKNNFKLRMNKKGVFFTVISIILLSVIIFGLVINTETRLKEKRLPIEARVNSVNNFIGDIEIDIERGLYIAAFRALLGLQQDMIESGQFVSNLNYTFEMLVTNGTRDGEYVDVIDEAEMNSWIQRISEKAEELLIDMEFEIEEVRIRHVSPWVIAIDIDVILDIADEKGTASWQRNNTITTHIDIEGFEDPLYTIHSNGGVIKEIERTNITDFVDEDDDPSNLLSHLSDSFYIETNISPSYLQRLEGNLDPSPNGIESLVNLQEFSQLEVYGVELKDGCSIVDFVYFDDNCENITSFLINNTHSWFRLDNTSINNFTDHVDFYEATDLVIPG